MNMKRIFCLVLCLMLALPAALAETADTLPKRFVRQLTGGNGARGYVSITASGVAEWLNLLLPFTASDIQIRAIGQKQGEMSEDITDDDAWQVKFYAKDSAGSEAGTTWLFGDPSGVYFQSELLPETILSVPVDQVHLLYQLFRGEFSELFFSFDPLALQAPGANGNASAYKAIADVLGIPAEDWEAEWMPVLEKHFLHLDLWLAGYGESSIVNEDSGALTMSASFTIPVDDLKAEAKYLIGQMLYDNDLQTLLLPYVTMEQRITYLNPQMLYFYEACIDALELTGDVVLSREMSAMGEVVSTTVELPLPALPEALTVPAGKAALALLELPYDDLLAGMNRIVLTQSGAEKTVILSGTQRTITVTAVESAPDESTAVKEGVIRVTPVAGVQENAVTAAFSFSYSHKQWQDEKYLDHDTTAFSLSVTPDLENISEEDPFRSLYEEFQPVRIAWTLDYRNNPFQENSAVQVNFNMDAQLPDAAVTAEAVLRITTQMSMEELSTADAEDFTMLSEERKATLLNAFVENAANTMTSLNETAADVAEETPEEAPAAPTSVPPMGE